MSDKTRNEYNMDVNEFLTKHNKYTCAVRKHGIASCWEEKLEHPESKWAYQVNFYAGISQRLTKKQIGAILVDNQRDPNLWKQFWVYIPPNQRDSESSCLEWRSLSAMPAFAYWIPKIFSTGELSTGESSSDSDVS